MRLSGLASSCEEREAFHLPENSGLSSRDVQVQLNYLKDGVVYFPKPIQITPNFLDVERRTTVRLEQGPVETIQDVRGREREFSLDTHGFQYLHAPTKFREWTSKADIAREYLPELETLLTREVGGCDEIMFYDARIRHADDAGHRVKGLSISPWAMQVHVDNTERSVLAKMKDLTELKHEFLLSGRVRIINIWRPMRHPVFDCGLAVADGSKLQATDVIECERHRQDTGKYWDTMGVVKFREGFEWFYRSQQTEDDVLLFKTYDNSTSPHVKARTCLHTAFKMPPGDVPADAPTRESVEVRALIFTYPENVARPHHTPRLPPYHAESSLQGAVRSLSHELRTDIDEGNEIKDALLMLRKQEIHKLLEERESLRAEREELAMELRLSRQRIEVQAGHIEVLLAKTKNLADRAFETPGHSAADSPNVMIVDSDGSAGSA